jgi:hypothetical protein
VNLHSHFRGGRPALSASLLYSVTAELLKWQFPIYAANEAAFALAARLRVLLFPQPSRAVQN